MIDMEDMRKIGLTPLEMQVLRYASFASSQDRCYVCTDGQRQAAELLIERGFLTKAVHHFSPPETDSLVVFLGDENRGRLKAAKA